MESSFRHLLGWRSAGVALLALLAVAGCPADQAGGQAADSAPGAAAAATSSAQHPASGDWVASDKLQYYLNDEIDVAYRVEPQAANSQPWIALVPAATQSQLAGDNFAARVEFAHLHGLPEGTTRFHAKHNGLYLLRLFGSRRDDAKLLAESEALRIGPPPGSGRKLDPPYVTLSGQEVPAQVVLRPGQVLAAYWMLADAPGPAAWIGMVPVTCTSADAADNLAAAVAHKPLGGKLMGPTRFMLRDEGEFVFRLFPSQDAGAELICESERFTVRAKSD